MSRLAARACAAAACVAGLAAARPALAGDGVYGRLDGDLDLSLGAGAGVLVGGAAFAARTSALYAGTAGLYLGYLDTFGQSGAFQARSLAAGVSLRPLFWGRFATNTELGVPRLDLLIDSLAFEIGAVWLAPPASDFEAEPGLEIAMGFGVPILDDATGPFLEVRGAARFRPQDLDGTGMADFTARGAVLTITLAWHHVVGVHIADAGDRLQR
ncbi:MAG: hypothetical protein R3B70_17125 [Polyangiaceae bacterium]